MNINQSSCGKMIIGLIYVKIMGVVLRLTERDHDCSIQC